MREFSNTHVRAEPVAQADIVRILPVNQVHDLLDRCPRRKDMHCDTRLLGNARGLVQTLGMRVVSQRCQNAAFSH